MKKETTPYVAEDGYYHYVYVAFNNDNRPYIGKHSTKELDDGYQTSCKDPKWLEPGVKHLIPKFFYDSHQEAIEAEDYYLRLIHKDKRPMFGNTRFSSNKVWEPGKSTYIYKPTGETIRANIETAEANPDLYTHIHKGKSNYTYKPTGETVRVNVETAEANPDLYTHITKGKVYDKKECPHCLNLISITTIERHIEACKDNPYNKCLHCSKTFTQKSILKKHIRICKDNPDRDPPSFGCPHCSKTYSTNGHLKRHTRTCEENPDRDPPSFKCPHCSKTFTTNGHLKRHIRDSCKG